MFRRLRRYGWLGYLIAALILMLIVFPALLVRGFSWEIEKSIAQGADDGLEVKLQISENQLESLPLEQYLVGVVAGEMPASFHEEALKAQAVAARTYTLLRISREEEDEEHPEADLCADPGHCQAWIDVAEMRKRWGFSFRVNYKKIAAAVQETKGQVLTYEGELIDPVYHASCGGRGTEDAHEVWGVDLPYLKSVPCNFDPPERQEPVVTQISIQDLFSELGVSEQSVPAAANSQGIVEIQERTVSGRTKSLKIGSGVYPSVEVRKELGLRSTDFQVSVSEEKVTFSTRGYGHGVGMCQYGADGLGKKGAKYQQILSYYYRGAKLEKR